MSFSKRYGYKPVREALQFESMDAALRNTLWNVLTIWCWDNEFSVDPTTFYSVNNQSLEDLSTELWMHYFKEKFDEFPGYWAPFLKYLRDYFFKCEWHEVYTFLEFVANNYTQPDFQERFAEDCNYYLVQEMSAYRLINGQITPITGEIEIEAIEKAASSKFDPVSTHINRALELLSDRETPDYRNSIKESISAVESIASEILAAEKGTLGQLLKQLESKMEIHPALKDAFSKLYGYTSDANGIRHALMDKENNDFHDAKFMLVTCSAFINYVEGKLQDTSDVKE